MATDATLYVGLMSGTSVDAIDSALVSYREERVEILATHLHTIPVQVKQEIEAISRAGPGEIERMGTLDRTLGMLFADATLALLATAGRNPGEVEAIGSHGQTIRHRPPSAVSDDTHSFTLQIGDPNTIAEVTGITTVADFRRRDIAADGEGAPLAPAFHAASFAQAGTNRAIVNIGGIANASLLEGLDLRAGFDTGPGNTLLDQWTKRHLGEDYDRDGQWSASGQVAPDLLRKFLSEPYFKRSGPRSTGKECFNLQWLDQQLVGHEGIQPANVQATLAELTATSIAQAIEDSRLEIAEIYICGGGASNGDLTRRLRERLAPATVNSTAAIGMDPDWVEAAMFAWLAARSLAGLAGNAPTVTGAKGPRVLGGIYPAGSREPGSFTW